MRLSSLIVAMLSLSAPVRALNASLDISQYAHTAWTLRDGAFRGYPKSLAQTSDGYLWLATEFGLLRFDGVRFVSWQFPSGTRLPSDSIVKLLATRDGSLWIGTTAGLARWKDKSLTLIPEFSGQYVSALLDDRRGAIWVGTSAGITGTAKLCVVENAGPNDRVSCDGHNGALGRFVICLYEDSKGVLWVGAASGLWRWTPGSPQVYAMRDPFSEIHWVTEDASGTILVALNREIDKVVAGSLQPYVLPTIAGRQIKPTSLLHDRHGNVWIGTQDQGLLHVHDGRLDRFVRADGLSGDLVTGLFEDVEGNVWIATLNGLDRFRDFAVVTLAARQGLSSDTVVSVLAGHDGSIWIGTVDGLNRWKDGTIAAVSLSPGAGREDVATLFEDRRGRLWVSSPRGLAFVENGRATPVSGVDKGYIHAIAEDGDETVWVSDQELGLFGLRNGRVATLVPWSDFEGRRVRALVADRVRGGLWLGFFKGGVAYFKDGRIVRSYSVADGVGDGEVTHLRLDDDGALWASTSTGLSRVKDDSVRTLTTRNGLPCDTVRWAMDDGAGALWLYTVCGLVRIAGSDIKAWLENPARVVRLTVYDSSDGVPSHSTVGSYSPRVARSVDGRLWFATYDGVGVIDPRHLPVNTIAPPVRIEQIIADRATYDASAELRLPPLVRDLRIDYTALSLTVPEKVRFRYKLEGRDEDWVEAGNRRQAFYTDLPPRAYRFRVVASNNDGVWNEAGALGSFSIQPALYQTSGFRFVVILLVALGGWALYRLRLARLAERLNVRFEERLAERTRIARELHDTLLQGSLSASMQLYLLADEVDPPVKSKLDHILKRLSQVNEEGRQTVQALRTQPSTSDDLELALARDAEDLRGSQAVNIHVVVEGKRRPLHPLIRDEVYRVGRECLANTFHHAGATRVEIEIEYAPDELRVKIRDNGCGIDPAIVRSGRPGHWGIHGMRERAERIGATLKLLSGVGAGTEIDVAVPAHVAFQQAASDRRRRWFGWMGVGN